MANASRAYFIPKASSASAVLDYFSPSDAVYPQNGQANALGRNNHPLVRYPQSQLNFVDFQGVFPEAGAIKVSIVWTSTVPGGAAVWQVAWERDNPTVFVPQANLDISSFAPDKSVVSPTPLVPGLLREASLTFTPAETGGILPGEPYRLRVTRNGLLVTDTLNAEAQLFRVILGAA